MEVYNQSVIGFSHIQKEIPVEDYSLSINENCQIVTVADGHGDPNCSRSHLGSQFACQIAIEQLIELGNVLIKNDKPSLNSLKKNLYEILSNNIFKGWKNKCYEHFKEFPIEDYQGDILHLYGSTLMAAMKFENQLLVLQQGDGHIAMVYEDGHVDMPVELDPRCIGNITTSLCDSDAEKKFSLSLFNLDEDKIIACFLGTDGVEDSFSSLDLCKGYYAEFCLDLIRGQRNFSQSLSLLSEKGSHDDISVGCLYDLEALARNEYALRSFIKKVSRKEEKRQIMITLQSKERKKSFYEKQLLHWSEQNKVRKEEYISKIQSEIKDKELFLKDVNDKISECNEFKKMNKKNKRPKDKISEIHKNLQKLEQSEKSPIIFQFDQAHVPEDRRNKYYCLIKNKMKEFPEFSFEKYDLIFSEEMEISSVTSEKIYEFIEDLTSYLNGIQLEHSKETLCSIHDVKKLRKERNQICSEMDSLNKKIQDYTPSDEYICFKNEYDAFMKEYHDLEKRLKSL